MDGKIRVILGDKMRTQKEEDWIDICAIVGILFAVYCLVRVVHFIACGINILLTN